MMKAAWADKAAKIKAQMEERKLAKDQGIVLPSTKRGNFGKPQQARASTATKKVIQPIDVDNLYWPEVKFVTPPPFAIKPEALRMQYDDAGNCTQPPEPSPVFATITNATSSPFVVHLHGGGSVPSPYGVTCKDNGDFGINFYVETPEEARKLTKFSDDAEVALQAIARTVYGACFIQHADLVVRVYTKTMPKKNTPTELWPSKLQVTIKKKELDSSEVAITKDDATPMTIIQNLEGMFWKDLNVFFNCLMFGWTWDENRKVYLPQIRILRKLFGKVIMTDNPEHAHLVFPHQIAEHTAQHCVRKHHVPIDILNLPPVADFVLKDPVMNKSKTGGKCSYLEMKDGTHLILKFPRGGVLPSYSIGKNQSGKDTFSLQFDDTKEFDACDKFYDDIIARLMQDRNKYFSPDDSEEVIRKIFKPLLKPASATAGNTQCRLLTAGIDLSGNGTSCMLVDENDQLVIDPDDLVSCRFTEAWVTILGVYFNATEVGFIKRITFVRRVPSKITYTLAEPAF